MSDNEATLYDRIGGEEAIERLVGEFYRRVLADALLSPFFAQANLPKLHLMQREFFSAALGGPIEYSGVTLSHSHQGRGIERKHFARFVELMLEVLEEFDLSDNEVNQIIARINTYTDDVIGGAGLDG